MKNSFPLCVDLDQSLINTDIIFESFFRAVKNYPLTLLMFPFWLLRGKAYLKGQLSKYAQKCDIDITTLPYNKTLIDYLIAEKSNQRKLVLVTGAQQYYANQIANHLSLFDEVHASNDHLNLSGANKAKKLTELYGAKQFDYIGNSKKDIPVWKASRYAITINATKKTQRLAEKSAHVIKNFPGFENKKCIIEIFKAIRPHQWLKNLLLFVPLICAHNALDILSLEKAIIAFFSFSALASATYIFNDLFDIDSDRHHPRKKYRPFAAGTLPVPIGVVCAFILLAISAITALNLGTQFLITLLSYLIITLSYTYKIKSQPILDVITLSILYTIRIIAGAIAIHVPISFWLLAFSLFFFLSLALIKRVSELLNHDSTDSSPLKGRDYKADDLVILKSMGISSGYLSIAVLALYINSSEVIALYKRPEWLWLICPVMLFWISRIWMITSRKQMHDDPIVFAAKDKASWFILPILATTLFLSI